MHPQDHVYVSGEPVGKNCRAVLGKVLRSGKPFAAGRAETTWRADPSQHQCHCLCDAVATGEGRYGAILQVKPGDVQKTAQSQTMVFTIPPGFSNGHENTHKGEQII